MQFGPFGLNLRIGVCTEPFILGEGAGRGTSSFFRPDQADAFEARPLLARIQGPGFIEGTTGPKQDDRQEQRQGFTRH